MRKISLPIIITILTFFASLAYAQSGTITVEILGIKEIKGQISIGLYNKSDDFPETGKAYKGVFVKVSKNTIKYTFSDIPDGDFAIAVFHDSNSNEKLDKNLFGLPKEAYAFSNNARTPSFDKAKFQLKGSYTAKITMKY
ncbi:MAG: DUF2141 domain-containing protein [Candidatus Hodarchaeota archaeon]